MKLVPDVSSGSTVRFKLVNVVCPEPDQIYTKVTNRLELTGRVVSLSDGGEQRNHYAIVQVGGIMSPLIVPVEQVEICDVAPPRPEAKIDASVKSSKRL